MKNKRIGSVIGGLAIGLGMVMSIAGAEPVATNQYSKADIQRLIRQAHTPGEYQALAGYFRARQHKFEQQAQAEKLEWERRSQNTTGLAAKYPRPVDSSKNRYEYFAYEADQMDHQAAHYESLASKGQ